MEDEFWGPKTFTQTLPESARTGSVVFMFERDCASLTVPSRPKGN
jgi:hypothetical protein